MQDDGTPGRTTSPSLPPYWGVRWFMPMLVTVYLGAAIHAAVDERRWDMAVFVAFFLPLMVAVVGAMALLAGAIRWMVSRRQSPRSAVSIVIGAAVGPVVLFLFFASGSPRMLLAPTTSDLAAVVYPPVVLGGATAAWLAEGWVSPRQPMWWATSVGAALLGLGIVAAVGGLP